MYPKTIRLFVSLLAFCLYGPVWADNNRDDQLFKINSPLHPPIVTEQHDGFEDRLAMELFTRLGLKPVIENVPAERGLRNLDQGIDDAILSRVAGLEKFYPNIVMIDEVANQRDYVAFTRNNIVIRNWDDLKNYDVAHIIGWKIFDNHADKYRTLIKVREPEQLFQLLERDRVDVVLYGLAAGQWMIRELGISNIHPVHPPLARKNKYFYLNKKHAHLVPKANEVLRQIKQDGTYNKLQIRSVKGNE